METTKLTKGQKTTLIIIALLALLDVSCLISSIVDHDKLWIVQFALLTVNTLAVCWVYYNYTQVVNQHSDAKKYKDTYFKYFDYQYDRANAHGYYEIEELHNMYWVCKCSEDCVVFIVKVFPYDPADEAAKATAKAKAEELLNLITENGKLWQ